MTDTIDRVLPSEAARIALCSPQRIRQLVDTGILPAVRVGGIRLIERRAVEIMAKERKRGLAPASR